MKLIDIVVIAVLIGVFLIICYITRNKKGEDACAKCHGSCTSCPTFKDFYKDYKKDQS